MNRASLGDGVAALTQVYRHALVRIISPLLAPLAVGGVGEGWSMVNLALAAVLMSWDAAPTLAQRFESVLGVLDDTARGRPRVGRTYQGFIKALRACGRRPLELVGEHLRLLTRQAAGACWMAGEFVVIGADGSRFDAPRTIGNEPLGFAGKDKCGPQMAALLLVHLGLMLPWAWRIGGVRQSERELLRGVLDTLPDRTLLVADAGFTGFELLGLLRARNIHFLIRVGRGVNLLKELGSYRREGKNTVYLWPDALRAQPPLVLRLIKVGSMHLITSVLDPRRLSHAAAGEIYRRRWVLETTFRALKQTLERRKMRSASAENAKLELEWSIVGLWMLALVGVRALRAGRRDPRSLSPARALAAVRAASRRRTTDGALARALREAVRDPYRRKGRKKAWRWAHKKNPKPPGTPQIHKATPAQVQQARLLLLKLAAA